MITLSRQDFVRLVNRDDVEFSIETKYHKVHCRHESQVPTKYAIIKYPKEGIEEVYYWQGEEWYFESVFWL